MNAIELKTTNYQSLIDQMNSLIEILNRHLHGHKGMRLNELVVDFVQDYAYGETYFLQFKFIKTYKVPIEDEYLKQRGLSPPKDKLQESSKLMKTLVAFNQKDAFECAGDYCNIDGLVSKHDLPKVH